MEKKSEKVFLFGTSNSIQAGNYYEQLLSSQSFDVVGSERVGDVFIGYFITVANLLEDISRYTTVDLVVVDSFINDSLMLWSEVISEKVYEISFKSFIEVVLDVFPRAKICFLNFRPKRVIESPTASTVIEIRRSILNVMGVKTFDVDIRYGDVNEYFKPKDPLHHASHRANDIVEKIADESNLCISSNGKFGVKSKVRTMKLTDFLNVDEFHFIQNIENSLVRKNAVTVWQDKDLCLSFENPVIVLGISYISSKGSSDCLVVESDTYNVSFKTKANYPKPIVRYMALGDDSLVPVSTLKLSYCNFKDIEDSNVLKTPNEYKGAADNVAEGQVSLLQVNYLTDPHFRKEIRPHKNISLSVKQRIKICFASFWPGFNPLDDAIFGDFLKKNYSVDYCDNLENADYLFLSWYSPNKNLKELHSNIRSEYPEKTLIYYTAEHDGAGLPGAGQLDFNIYDYTISHYSVNTKKNIWMPNYVRRYGLDVFTRTNEMFILNAQKDKGCGFQFCYSNDACEVRNRHFHYLNNLTKVDCGGSLYNDTGVCLSRSFDEFVDQLSQYKFVFAYENSSFSGYTTEKIVHAFMAGSIPLYWGDPNVGRIWNDRAFIGLNDQNYKSVFSRLSADSDKIFSGFLDRMELPFIDADVFESKLQKYYKDSFDTIFEVS